MTYVSNVVFQMITEPFELSREFFLLPVPPDLVLIPLAVAQPEFAFPYAGIATAGSVTAGLLGYTIGRKGVGPPSNRDSRANASIEPRNTSISTASRRWVSVHSLPSRKGTNSSLSHPERSDSTSGRTYWHRWRAAAGSTSSKLHSSSCSAKLRDCSRNPSSTRSLASRRSSSWRPTSFESDGCPINGGQPPSEPARYPGFTVPRLPNAFTNPPWNLILAR